MEFMVQKVKIFILFILGFCIFKEIDAKNHKSPPYWVHLCQTIETIGNELKDELNLDFWSKQITLRENIEGIKMNFQVNRRASIEEARSIHLFIMHRLLENINHLQGIAPYLAEYPFTHKRIGISLRFEGTGGRNFDGSVTYLSNLPCKSSPSGYKLCYRGADPFTDTLISLLEEPYETAVMLAEASPVNPRTHKTTELEEVSDQVFYRFAKELNEKNELYVTSIGGKMTNGIEEVGAKLIAFGPGTVERARKLELLAAEKLSRALNQEPKLKPYLKPYPFPTSHLKICIEFKQKEKTAWGYLSYDDGSIDNVKMESDLISYYRTRITNGKAWEAGRVSPTHPPLIAKETFKEALEAVQNTPSQKKKK